MTIEPRLMTAEELQELPRDYLRHELIEGELRTMPFAGHEHGFVGMAFATSLGTYVREERLGQVFAAGTGFFIATGPDTVCAPDISFVTTERLNLITEKEGFFPGSPDLAVEVSEPHERYSEVEEKVKVWLQHGTRMVLVLDPRTETLKVYRSPSDVQILTREDTLEGGDVVPGWTLFLAELFANL